MADYDKRPARSGHRTFDQQQILRFTHLHHAQVLRCHIDVAHVTGHPHVLEHAARKQTLTDRATAAVPPLRAVR